MTSNSIFSVVSLSILTAALLAACSSGCQNKIQSEIANSDNTFKAVVFSRDCGTTTGANTQVSIIPAGAGLGDETGNVFIEDRNHSDSVSLDVKVVWQSPTSLLIESDSKARTFKRLEAYTPGTDSSHKISIKYGALVAD